MNEINDKNQNNPEKDPRLLKLIGLLRPTPPRDPQTVKQNRARYMAQVDVLIGSSEQPSQKKKVYWFQPKEKTNMNRLKPRFALTALFVMATLLVFLFGSAGLTVYAAQSSLPGDALYPVKTTFEQTRLSLTSDADQEAQLHLSLAQQRLDEIQGLIKEGRFDQVGNTSAEFERQIQQVVEALKRLAEKDPARAGELTTQLMTELSTYTKALTGMLSSLPEDVKVEVEHAIAGSESAGLWEDEAKQVEFTGEISSMTAESWTISGRQVMIVSQTEIKGSFGMGDMVKVHAMVGPNGVLTALEIDPSVPVGNSNDNQNVNANSNENENANTNVNENINENVNENENSNDNGNANLNENENENENANANENESELTNQDKFEFKGTVQTILPDMWVISGITVSVSSTTVLNGDIAVGDSVEVYTANLSDGTMQALVIKLEDGGSNNANENDHGSSIGNDNQSNDNGSEIGGTDGNSNDSGGEHDGGSSNDNSGGPGGGNENDHDD